jgi:branched-chain amino acid aminotransferase
MYAQSNIAGASARAQGFDEGVFLNMEGRIAEGPGENIIIIKDNKLTTNDETESILPGITRTTALKLAEDMGYDVEIAPITVEAFFAADEVFFTGTAAEITPVCRITDGREQTDKAQDLPVIQIGDGTPGPVTRKILQKYAAVVRGKATEYENWLTYIYDSKEELDRYFNE